MVAREEVATPRWAAKYRLTGGRIAGGYLLVGPREGLALESHLSQGHYDTARVRNLGYTSALGA